MTFLYQRKVNKMESPFGIVVHCEVQYMYVCMSQTLWWNVEQHFMGTLEN